jgi:hypothetical protein
MPHAFWAVACGSGGGPDPAALDAIQAQLAVLLARTEGTWRCCSGRALVRTALSRLLRYDTAHKFARAAHAFRPMDRLCTVARCPRSSSRFAALCAAASADDRPPLLLSAAGVAPTHAPASATADADPAPLRPYAPPAAPAAGAPVRREGRPGPGPGSLGVDWREDRPDTLCGLAAARSGEFDRMLSAVQQADTLTALTNEAAARYAVASMRRRARCARLSRCER